MVLGPLGAEAFRYHRWANLHLLDVCGALTDEQLQLTAAGTYGTIGATLMHLVGAEQRYIWRLTGAEPRFKEKDGFPGVAALRELAAGSADRMIELAQEINPDDEIEATFSDGRHRLRSGVVLVQALHHGNDHRTHICTVLGSHGISYGDMDVWAYGDAVGAIVPLGAG